jgi:O-antigen/teichoic acid export membrane protein
MTSVDKQAQKRPSLKLNALSNFAGLAVNVAIGFFLVPAMLRYLGEKQFGIWTLVSSVVGYAGLLEFGVGSAVFRYVPMFHGQGNHEKVSAVISTSMVFYTALSLVIILVTQTLAYPIANFFDGGPELATLLRIVGLAAALSMPTIVLNTSVISYEGFALSNFVTASTQLLRGLLLVGCMWAGYGLVAMGWAIFLVNVASLIGNSVTFKRVCHDARLSFKAVGWAELKMLLTFGSVILIVSTANSLATESPKQIVAKTISLEALGLFGIPLLLIGYYRMLIISLTKVFSPRFSYLSGRQDNDEIRRLFVQGCRYMAVIAGAVGILLWVIGPSFLLLWTKKPLIATVAPALTIMAAGTFVFLSHRLGGDLLFGLGRQKEVAILELVEAIGIVGLTIILSLKFGMMGAALGVAIPPILVRGIMQIQFVSRALSLTFFQYYSQCILRSWFVVVLLGALAQLVNWKQIVIGWPSLMCASALLIGVYGVLVLFFVLHPGERKQCKDEAFRFFNRLGLLRAS